MLPHKIFKNKNNVFPGKPIARKDTVVIRRNCTSGGGKCQFIFCQDWMCASGVRLCAAQKCTKEALADRALLA